MTERFAYDEVPYDTEANTEAHPRSMATLGRLLGIPTAPPSRARVLEIGCGDGAHLVAAAAYLPEARFVGFDLSADAIARGEHAAAAVLASNVELLHRDVREVKDLGRFDYVIAHGVYSWVPESIRGDVLAVIGAALQPNGIGFLSVNARPGWELRRALRMLMREAASSASGPADQVRAALALVDDLASVNASADGFVSVLAAAAREYREHVTRATPPDAPFSHYVFHDLLANCNDPFSVEDLQQRLRAQGLRLLCETPLLPARALATTPADVPWLAAQMTANGSPFLQVLVCRDDAAPDEPTTERALTALREMHLWADLATVDARSFRTTTGAVLRASGDAGLARAARAAPGFVAVRSLADDETTLADLARDLFISSCEGLLTIASEPARIARRSPCPRVTLHVRQHARAASAAHAPTAVLTSALHRSFRVRWAELVVIRELDGETDEQELRARVRRAITGGSAELAGGGALARGDEHAIAAHVEAVLDRFGRYGFFVADEETAP